MIIITLEDVRKVEEAKNIPIKFTLFNPQITTNNAEKANASPSDKPSQQKR